MRGNASPRGGRSLSRLWASVQWDVAPISQATENSGGSDSEPLARTRAHSLIGDLAETNWAVRQRALGQRRDAVLTNLVGNVFEHRVSSNDCDRIAGQNGVLS